MLQKRYILCILSILVMWVCKSIAQKQLPSFIKPCSKSAPDFDACCVEHGKEALQSLVKGDREYNIPPLNPLILPSVGMDAGDFQISFTDLHVIGIENCVLKKATFDLKNNKLEFLVLFDRISLVGKYKCDGRILVLPIQGDGNINITVVEFEAHYQANYAIEERGGEKYIKLPEDAAVDISMKRAYFDIDNLFDGNKELGDITVKALNDEWEKFVESIKPFISSTIATIVQSIAGAVTTLVPLKHIFLD